MAKEKGGLPVKRTPEEIMAADKSALNAGELAFRSLYEEQLEREDQEPQNVLLRLEVASSQQLMKLPDGTASNSLDLLILGWIVERQNWEKKSDDAEHGELLCASIGGKIGTPTEVGRDTYPYLVGQTIQCSNCLANVWGTGINGKGKQCKEMRKLLVYHPSCASGLKLSIPPSSIVAFDEYRARVNSKRKVLMAHWTNVTLLPAGTKPRIWSLFKFELGDPVDYVTLSTASAFRERFKEALGTVDEDDYFGKPTPRIVDEPELEPQEPPDPAPTEEDELPF